MKVQGTGTSSKKWNNYWVFGNLEPVWGVLLSVVYLLWFYNAFVPPLIWMIDDLTLPSSGVVAPNGYCRVAEFRVYRGSTWTFSVKYVAQDGAMHSPDVDTWLWWREPDKAKPCTVYFNPKSPEHVGTDWGASRLVGRAIAYLVMIPLPLAVLIGILAKMRQYVTARLRYGRSETIVTTAPHLWRGYCGSLINRRNRRLFVSAVVLLSIGSLAFIPPYDNRAYWSGFFHGPRHFSGQDLASPTLSPRHAGFIQIDASHSVTTGVDAFGTHASGWDGYYFWTQVDGKTLLVHTNTPETHRSYSGIFKPLKTRVKNALSEKGYELAPGFLGDNYLDTAGQESLSKYRKDGFQILLYASPFFIWGFSLLWLALRRTVNHARHPFARALARRGALDAIVPQIDAEMAQRHKAYDKLKILPHWLILEKYWVPVPARISDIVQVDYKKTKPTACVVVDKLGELLEAEMQWDWAKQARDVIGAMAPEAVRGERS